MTPQCQGCNFFNGLFACHIDLSGRDYFVCLYQNDPSPPPPLAHTYRHIQTRTRCSLNTAALTCVRPTLLSGFMRSSYFTPRPDQIQRHDKVIYDVGTKKVRKATSSQSPPPRHRATFSCFFFWPFLGQRANNFKDFLPVQQI